MKRNNHLAKAVATAIDVAGGQAALARKVGTKQQTVYNWLHRQRRVPAERVLAIEAATGVSRHVLRPDIYPPSEAA